MSEHSPREQGRGRLVGVVVPVSTLDQQQRQRMFELLNQYYVNVEPAQFRRDLDEKESTLLLNDSATGQIVGFTTMMQIPVNVDGQPIVGFFSGDTILDQAYWGDGELTRVWMRHVFQLRDEADPAMILYWFLIVKGHITYRYLPLLFREFYPNCSRPTPPDIQARLDALAFKKFPDEYDSQTGLVRPHDPAPLMPGIADVTPQRAKNPHVKFFSERNPGHAAGDEMVCLTEVSRSNLTRMGRRVVDG